MLTALFWLAFGALVILALAGWAFGAAKLAETRRLRQGRADLLVQVASLEEQLAAAGRQAVAAGAADNLLASLLAGDVPRETKERDEDGYLLCTGCRQRRQRGQKPVQGCGDCRWLNDGEPTDELRPEVG